MFTLKQYDIPLLSFELTDDTLDGQKCHILQVFPENERLLPPGLKADDAALMRWPRGRIIPKSREYVDALLPT